MLDDWRLDDVALWLGGWLGDLTFDLVYILSWISRGLSTCLGLELIVTDDATSWDDDQTDGYAVAVTVPFFVLLASWVLHTLRVGFLKPLLVGSKRTLAGSSIRVVSLVFSWNWKDLRRLKSSTSPQAYCIWWFLSIYHWVFHSYLVSLLHVIDLLLWCVND